MKFDELIEGLKEISDFKLDDPNDQDIINNAIVLLREAKRLAKKTANVFQ